MKKYIAIGLLLVSSASHSALADEYAVVVNAGNEITSDYSQIKNFFLKKQTSWKNGEVVVPLGRLQGSAEQQAFNKIILAMSDSELSEYWQSQKQKTGDTPPKEVGSESILFRQIKRKAGAFSVVKASAKLPSDVKVLFTFAD